METEATNAWASYVRWGSKSDLRMFLAIQPAGWSAQQYSALLGTVVETGSEKHILLLVLAELRAIRTLLEAGNDK